MSLSVLSANMCALQDEYVSMAGAFSHLTNVWLSAPVERVPPGLATMSTLTKLTLCDTCISKLPTGPYLQNLTHFGLLKYKYIPACWPLLENAQQLHTLELGLPDNYLLRLGPFPELAGLERLKSLALLILYDRPGQIMDLDALVKLRKRFNGSVEIRLSDYELYE